LVRSGLNWPALEEVGLQPAAEGGSALDEENLRACPASRPLRPQRRQAGRTPPGEEASCGDPGDAAPYHCYDRSSSTVS
jgi:hypothetical protein